MESTKYVAFHRNGTDATHGFFTVRTLEPFCGRAVNGTVGSWMKDIKARNSRHGREKKGVEIFYC